jgi:hypothetical protein
VQYEIHFLGAVSRPQVYRDKEERTVYFTSNNEPEYSEGVGIMRLTLRLLKNDLPVGRSSWLLRQVQAVGDPNIRWSLS